MTRAIVFYAVFFAVYLPLLGVTWALFYFAERQNRKLRDHSPPPSKTPSHLSH